MLKSPWKWCCFSPPGCFLNISHYLACSEYRWLYFAWNFGGIFSLCLTFYFHNFLWVLSQLLFTYSFFVTFSSSFSSSLVTYMCDLLVYFICHIFFSCKNFKIVLQSEYLIMKPLCSWQYLFSSSLELSIPFTYQVYSSNYIYPLY